MCESVAVCVSASVCFCHPWRWESSTPTNPMMGSYMCPGGDTTVGRRGSEILQRRGRCWGTIGGRAWT